MAETINKRIRRYRRAAKITQKDAAEALGLETSTYSQRERNGEPTVEFVYQLSVLLDVDFEELALGPRPYSMIPKKLVIPKEHDPERPYTFDKNIVPPSEMFTVTFNEKDVILMMRNMSPHQFKKTYKLIYDNYKAYPKYKKRKTT